MDGILLINKPKGWTSFDVVAKVRGMVKKETGVKRSKVGHAGTLDPLATGLLVVLVGAYCKRAQEYSKQDKVYNVELTLGQTSTTDDDEGEKTDISDYVPTQEQIEIVLESFKGEIDQVPPIFSAIKVDGKRAYKLAREGKDVALASRKVTIYDISNMSYVYPKLSFGVEVSSGTYIRSLARDIGEKLEIGAYMSALTRTSVGSFTLTSAHDIGTITSETLKDYLLA